MSVKEHKEKENVHEHEKPVVQAQEQSQGVGGKLTQVGDIYPFKASDTPYPQPEDTSDTPPWEKAEFKRKVLEAGFPGSPASDGAFLQALFKFAGGKVEVEPEAEHKAEHKK